MERGSAQIERFSAKLESEVSRPSVGADEVRRCQRLPVVSQRTPFDVRTARPSMYQDAYRRRPVKTALNSMAERAAVLAGGRNQGRVAPRR